mmetsp:Transcript_57765/g.183079  ORF Transcript_57765/g.183079 Transcript_57765/m.183079 type:complete len:100 (+) Transcript_57765:4521-4820(+)
MLLRECSFRGNPLLGPLKLDVTEAADDGRDPLLACPAVAEDALPCFAVAPPRAIEDRTFPAEPTRAAGALPYNDRVAEDARTMCDVVDLDSCGCVRYRA